MKYRRARCWLFHRAHWRRFWFTPGTATCDLCFEKWEFNRRKRQPRQDVRAIIRKERSVRTPLVLLVLAVAIGGLHTPCDKSCDYINTIYGFCQ